jgi:DNA-binding XRE family transcriptional regulator
MAMVEKCPLQLAREARNMSRAKLALILGVSYTTIQAVESGRQQTFPEKWRAQLEAAGLNYEALAKAYPAWRAALMAAARETA